MTRTLAPPCSSPDRDPTAAATALSMPERSAQATAAAVAPAAVGSAESVTAALVAHPNISVSYEEITELPSDGNWIIATGPLTSSALGQAIAAETGADALAFFDAIAPIVYFDSIDMSKAWMQSRYDKGETEEERTAYLNCPMDKEQYDAFIDALLAADKTEFHEGETAGYFDGCLPIEVMAERGRETLRHGPMKPVGLTNPHQPEVKAHAVVQLRRDNKLGTLYNIVGFQTKMKYGAQADVFKTIPGLENARFARLGGIHRNTFLNSPTLLDDQMRLRSAPNVRFAGQITGVEGYVESSAMGLLAGRMAAAEIMGTTLPTPPETTAMGALITHITGGADAKTFQPMNVTVEVDPEKLDEPHNGLVGSILHVADEAGIADHVGHAGRGVAGCVADLELHVSERDPLAVVQLAGLELGLGDRGVADLGTGRGGEFGREQAQRHDLPVGEGQHQQTAGQNKIVDLLRCGKGVTGYADIGNLADALGATDPGSQPVRQDQNPDDFTKSQGGDGQGDAVGHGKSSNGL